MFDKRKIKTGAIKGNKLLVLCQLFCCFIKVYALDICFSFFPVIDTDYRNAV